MTREAVARVAAAENSCSSREQADRIPFTLVGCCEDHHHHPSIWRGRRRMSQRNTERLTRNSWSSSLSTVAPGRHNISTVHREPSTLNRSIEKQEYFPRNITEKHKNTRIFCCLTTIRNVGNPILISKSVFKTSKLVPETILWSFLQKVRTFITLLWICIWNEIIFYEMNKFVNIYE